MNFELIGACLLFLCVCVVYGRCHVIIIFRNGQALETMGRQSIHPNSPGALVPRLFVSIVWFESLVVVYDSSLLLLSRSLPPLLDDDDDDDATL